MEEVAEGGVKLGDSIVVAIISVGGSLLVSIISYIANRKGCFEFWHWSDWQTIRPSNSQLYGARPILK